MCIYAIAFPKKSAPENESATTKNHLLYMEAKKRMNRTQWLRLTKEGENICAILRQQDYQCRKQTRRLTWKIGKEGNSYVLTWLPAPVNDWSLIPNDTNPARETLWNIIQSTLSTLRSRTVPLPSSTPQPENYGRPWAIIRLLPDLRRYTVARFHNRTDAQDHLRFLHRFMPAAEFEIIFDVPSESECN